jgi:N-carbamoylputrescine amidase
VAAVNRIGQEGDTLFWGRSFAANPYGEVMAEGSTTEEDITIVTCDLELQEDFRRIWPFFRDRRIDSFDGLRDRWGS